MTFCPAGAGACRPRKGTEFPFLREQDCLLQAAAARDGYLGKCRGPRPRGTDARRLY
jgi:hypothetical protein